MGILGISIDGTVVLLTLVKEVKFDGALVAVLVALATNEPVVGLLGLTGYGDIVGRLSLQVDALVPVACNVADKLECIVESSQADRLPSAAVSTSSGREPKSLQW